MKSSKAAAFIGEVAKVEGTSNIFPVKVGFKIIKNRISLERDAQPYIEMRDKIISKYSNGKGILREQDENYDICKKEIAEIDEEISPKIEKIKLSEIENLNLPIDILSSLSFMIEDFN